MSFQLDSWGVLRLETWQDLTWLHHGFTTRQTGDFASRTSYAECLRRLGTDGMPLTTVRQIHSDRVHLLDGAEGAPEPSRRPEADAIVSALPGRLLGVRIADCLPLLLVDRAKRVVAAVHAGWRGTRQQIAARAVEAMRTHFGCSPRNLEVAIGPGIQACCFEVGPEVAGQFDPSLVSAPEQEGVPASGKPGPSSQQRPRIDLVEANRRQLIQHGVPAQAIWSTAHCTRCERDFFSYRRSGEAARMLGFIGIKT